MQQGTGRLMSTCFSSHYTKANTLIAECSRQSEHAVLAAHPSAAPAGFKVCLLDPQGC